MDRNQSFYRTPVVTNGAQRASCVRSGNRPSRTNYESDLAVHGCKSLSEVYHPLRTIESILATHAGKLQQRKGGSEKKRGLCPSPSSVSYCPHPTDGHHL